MIVDCRTHIWNTVEQLGTGAPEYLARQGGEGELSAAPADHEAAARCVDKTLVFAYRSQALNACVPNDLVARYVAGHPERMIGVAAVDPTEDGALDEATELLDRREFRGLAISPVGQLFHPADSRAIRLYELAARRGAPVFFEQGTHFPTQGRMEYGRPLLIDEIASEYPELTLVLGSLGHPWVEEGIALVGKHPRVFADIAGLIRRPWQAYNALVLAHQFNVTDKVLFGSDFPFGSAAEAIESVYRMHEMTQGTNLPTVPREALRSIIERNALEALGIALPNEIVPDSETEDDDVTP